MSELKTKLHPEVENELRIFQVPVETVEALFEDASWALRAAATQSLPGRKKAVRELLTDSGFEVDKSSSAHRVVFVRDAEFRVERNGVVTRRFTFLGDLDSATLVLVGAARPQDQTTPARIRERLEALSPAKE